MNVATASVSFDLGEADLVAFNQHYQARSPSIRASRRRTYLISIFVTAMMTLFIFLSDKPLLSLPVTLFFLVLYWAFIIWSLKRHPRRVITRLLSEGNNRGLYGRKIISISPSSVREEWRHGETRHDWVIIEKIEIISDYLFIYTSSVAALVIPRRAFAAEAAFVEFCRLASTYHSAQAPGICKKCGYDLTGLANNRCPECGLAFEPQGSVPIAKAV